MKGPYAKIFIILIIVFLIPAISYTVFEINSLTEDEEMIKEIYSNQLDAILFSVNQSSNDIAEAWSNKVLEKIDDRHEGDDPNFEEILHDNLYLNAVVLFDDLWLEKSKVFMKSDTIDLKTYTNQLKLSLGGNKAKIDKLMGFMENGYRKLEPLGNIGNGKNNPYNDNLLVFVVDRGEDFYQYAGILIDPRYFIEQALAPKMQAISQEKFIITAINSLDNSLVYATESTQASLSRQQRTFWLFPDYYLGIVLKGKTMETLVQERAATNILLLLGLNLALFGGLWLVFRNMKKALQLAQAKSDFVSNVSHEIRTPLSLISMFAETLQMNRLQDENKKKEYYKVIGQEANRLAGIVNKILNFSKMEANKKVYQFQSEDLNDIVNEVLKIYDYHLKNNGFAYQVINNEDNLPVNVDKSAIEEAVINLIDNAMKYSGQNHSIVIETGIEGEYAYVSVKDHGIGISKADRMHIFDKFYRVDMGEVHNTKGTGLGLTLVKHIADAHGGKIDLVSQLGEGSTFRVLVPRINAQ
ncbi:HAMP domain-containing sensor histidine kinase [Fulvivirgaceae bacterium BMA12]|uniref:histidine kinase n=1 Tax=Agaribacillus aureus TaxID=3051825 RepID=A0ABT8L7R9_9BACT|nr:HAMP domain-containing sensor histidine kinase [Fulvivirgaceae bacterium BMA12]